MGMYAAQNMCGRAEEFGIDTKFELFSHITRFFGYKVILQDVFGHEHAIVLSFFFLAILCY